jgi:hypothetical protein
MSKSFIYLLTSRPYIHWCIPLQGQGKGLPAPVYNVPQRLFSPHHHRFRSHLHRLQVQIEPKYNKTAVGTVRLPDKYCSAFPYFNGKKEDMDDEQQGTEKCTLLCFKTASPRSMPYRLVRTKSSSIPPFITAACRGKK